MCVCERLELGRRKKDCTVRGRRTEGKNRREGDTKLRMNAASGNIYGVTSRRKYFRKGPNIRRGWTRT